MRKWTEEKIVGEIKLSMEQCGKFPAATYLQNNNRWDLSSAILKNGGYVYFRKLLNVPLAINPPGYWEENYRYKIEELVGLLGRFPSTKEMKEIGGKGFFSYIFDNNLLVPLREEFNYVPAIKPLRYWHDFNNLVLWLREHFGSLLKMGVLPTADMLNGVKGGGAVKDAIRLHGGFLKVAQKLNCNKNKFMSPDGHYLDSTYELIVDWYLWSRDIKHEIHGKISPEHNYRYDFKIKNHYVEVWGFAKEKFGGQQYTKSRKTKEKLYKKLGYSLISLEMADFDQSYAEIEKTLDKIFSSYGYNIKRKKNTHEINSIMGGRYYWTFDNTLKEITELVSQFGHFPSTSEMKSIGKKQVQKAMQKFGGQNVFRELLGCPLYIRQTTKTREIAY